MADAKSFPVSPLRETFTSKMDEMKGFVDSMDLINTLLDKDIDKRTVQMVVNVARWALEEIDGLLESGKINLAEYADALVRMDKDLTDFLDKLRKLTKGKKIEIVARR